MPRDMAVLFDLDDTLYPYRRFRTSGLLAVADRLSSITGEDSRLYASTLLAATRGVTAGREIHACLVRHELPATLAPELEDVFHHHPPRLRRLPGVTRSLVGLRAMGYRLGVLTNGQPTIEARKVAALGLEPFLDVVVYAAAHTVAGKPDPEAFAAAARQLGVPAGRIIAVGADEVRDVRGALAAGMRAIRCDVWRRRGAPTAAAARLSRLADLPALVGAVSRDTGGRRAA
jgi:HAD superfamily hydrolase (TIGR01509 family)